jgi:hypothetical protein
MIDNQCNPLMIPSQLIILETLPKLGSGKMDTAKAKQIAIYQTTIPNTVMPKTANTPTKTAPENS